MPTPKSSYLFSILLVFISLSPISCIFEDKGDVAIVRSMIGFQSAMLHSDFLISLLVCSEDVENCVLLEPIYKEFATANKDFLKAAAIVCDSTPEMQEIRLCHPDQRASLPYLSFFEPPEVLIHPLTKQITQPKERSYQGDANVNALSAFAKQFVPAFREVISSKERLVKFLKVEEIPNKVLLFTNKEQTSLLYRSLASEFRKLLLFGEIRQNAKELMDEYGITKYPTLLIEKRNEDGSFERIKYEEEMNIEKLRAFLKSYALAERANYVPDIEESSEEAKPKQETPKPQEKHEEKKETPKVEKPKSIPVTAETFDAELSKHERVVLVHLFAESKYPIIDQVYDKFGAFFEYFDLDCNDGDNEIFARETLHVRLLPALVALPVGKVKKMSAKVAFSKSKTLEEIVEGVSDLVGDKVMDISAREMQNMITTSLVNKKPASILMYETDEVSMTFRMITQLSKYSDKLTFAKMKNPGAEVLKHFDIKKLPALLSVLYESETEDEDLDPQKVKIVKYSGRYNYENMTKYFDAFLPRDDILEKMNIKKQVNEIATQQDLTKYCPTDSRFCVIGLLNGDKSSEISQAKLDDKIVTLKSVLKKFSHVPFAWIDAVCHSEVLSSLNIQSEDIPTVIVYSSVMKEYAQLVGTFDNGSISGFVDKVSKRKLSLSGAGDGIVLQERNCGEVHEVIRKQESGYENKGDDDEFMKEYLEELRKREEEDSTGKKKKKKKKKFDDEL